MTINEKAGLDSGRVSQQGVLTEDAPRKANYSRKFIGDNMKKRQIYIASLPAVSHDFALELSKRFPTKPAKPGVTQDELLYNAGERNVVDFIIASATGTTISGDVSDIKETANSKSLLQKLIGNLT